MAQERLQRQSTEKRPARIGSPEFEATRERLTRTLSDLVGFQTVADGQHTQEMRGIFDYIGSRMVKSTEQTGRQFVTREWNNNGHLSTIITRTDPTRSEEDTLLHPKIAMLIHADVVHAENSNMFTMRQEGDRLTGRGTLDMKGGLAIGLDLLADMPVGGALIVTSDEERGGADGAQFLAENIGVNPDFLIVLDGQKPEHISYGAKGGWHAQVTFGSLLNRGGHGSRHEDYSATELCMDLRNMMRVHYPWRYGHSPSGTTFNIGIMEGGVATNKIAENASINVDMRFPNHAESARGKEAMRNSCREVILQRLHETFGHEIPFTIEEHDTVVNGRQSHEVEIVHRETGERHSVATITTLVDNDPYEINRDDARIQRFKEIIEELTGEEVKINERDTGLHDGGFWPNTPALVYLPEGGGAHMGDEWVSANSLTITREAIRQLMLEELA